MPPNLYQQENSIPLMKILDIQEPAEGGLLSTIEGMSVPYKGFPQPHIVYALGNLKKSIKNLLLLHLNFKGLFLFFLFKKYRKRTLELFGDYCENATHYLTTTIPEYPQNPKKWCKFARELWRAGRILNKDIWKAVILALVETDNAYRFRLFDFFKLSFASL